MVEAEGQSEGYVVITHLMKVGQKWAERAGKVCACRPYNNTCSFLFFLRFFIFNSCFDSTGINDNY